MGKVSEVTKQVEVKLVRVLQGGKIERLGDEKSISPDVRIIGATKRDLEKEVKEGRFRRDLYCRINVVPIKLLPLRERKGDIGLPVQYFVQEAESQGRKSRSFQRAP
nr:hypothetical protein [Desulfobacterales bacterium]